ncbi:hypothetical protein [Bhargavaea massiliensis]|uniref:hypothetical protein n=1 Tax=Bhargavaea massiliensis TaxID=2697500 RepID=UPI001BD0A0FC|nr:hypothetical protein [Bhargavaea massiliensis]
MGEINYIRSALKKQGFPALASDLPVLAGLMAEVSRAESDLREFPEVTKQLPVTVVQKELLK